MRAEVLLGVAGRSSDEGAGMGRTHGTRVARALVPVVVAVALIAAVPATAAADTTRPYVTVAGGTIKAATLSGGETGSPLGAGSFSGTQNISITGSCPGGTAVLVTETLTHITASGDRVFGTATLTGCATPGPVSLASGTETFTGGTGAFAGARGSVRVFEARYGAGFVAAWRFGSVTVPSSPFPPPDPA
jgi:hypothetical protein